MLDILYYYYYLLYTKLIPEVSPHFTAVWVLSLVLALIITGIGHLFLVVFFKIPFKQEYIILFAVIFFAMYLRYIKSGRGKRVIKQKPMLKGSNKLSIIYTASVTLMALIVIFLFPIITHYILHRY